MPNLSSLQTHGDGELYGVLVETSVYDSEGNLPEFIQGTERNEEIDYFIGESSSSADETDYYITRVKEKLKWNPGESNLNGEDVDFSGESNHYIVYASPTPVPEGIAGILSEMSYKARNMSVVPLLFSLWLLGTALLLGYGLYSCHKVKRMVKNAIPYENNVFLCDGLESPFLFGWIYPKIYLPTNLEEDQIQYVVLHESSHVARGDHYAKLLGYILLSVYWFNPFVWLAYVLFCKDVERACDEKAVLGLSGEDRKGYAETLLQCSANRKFIISNPLAFGEMDVKKRITGILNYKTPGRWLTLGAVLLCLVAAAGCFFVNRKNGNSSGGISVPIVTPTPTPTVAPTSPPRGTGPYTPTPTPAEIKHTPTPLPPSDLSLLGNCTKETVLPVPFGQTVTVDLNGDGVAETVTFGLEGYEGDVSLRDLEEAHVYTYEKVEDLYYLQINDRVWTQPEIQEEFWDHYGVGSTTYYIFDVDTTDKYKEIGIYFPGPNTPTGVALFRYFNGELYCIGNFMSQVLKADDESYEAWKMPYDEMVTKINREGYLITVPGDGTILCEERRDCMETSFAVLKYKLYSASSGRYAQLREVLRYRYEFSGWQVDRGEFNVRAAKDFYAYLEPVDMSQEFHKDLEAVKIPEGTRVSFYAYYPDNEWTAGWVQFAYGENLEKFAWFYKGVDATGRFMLYLPNTTEKFPDVLFYNLSKAG